MSPISLDSSVLRIKSIRSISYFSVKVTSGQLSASSGKMKMELWFREIKSISRLVFKSTF